MMKPILIALLAVLSNLASAATPDTITCTRNHVFGFWDLTGVTFRKVDATTYQMNVFNGKFCTLPESEGCVHKVDSFTSSVNLMESPVNPNLMITPDFDDSGTSISIDVASGKCRIRSKDFKLKGKVRTWPYFKSDSPRLGSPPLKIGE